MKIWIDADASPREMKEIVFRAGKRLGIDVVLVANQSIVAPVGFPRVTSVCVRESADAADRYIVDNAEAGDVAVTADIALAAQLVANAVVAIDPRGMEYTADAVGERLSVRDFMEGLRGAGLITGGPAAYGPQAKQAFAATLDRALTRLSRRRTEPT